MECKNNPQTIVLTVIITALIVGGGVFVWQNKTIQKTAELKTPIVTNNSTESLDTTQTNCQQNGSEWTKYESQDFSFCYIKSWGTPKLLDETHKDGKGKLFHLAFANNENKNNVNSTPDIWWESKDFAPAVSDYSTTCFKCIDFNQDETQIIEALGLKNKNATAQKLVVSGKKVLRIHLDYLEPEYEQGQINSLDYYIPNAFGDYNFQVTIGYQKADEADTFIKTLLFK